jgi:hypothetical protein
MAQQITNNYLRYAYRKSKLILVNAEVATGQPKQVVKELWAYKL